jgi:hypothetical protein
MNSVRRERDLLRARKRTESLQRLLYDGVLKIVARSEGRSVHMNKFAKDRRDRLRLGRDLGWLALRREA